ncbi:MAG TPA: hypothetical protein VGK73_34810 [Polyangiaceae bacterium]
MNDALVTALEERGPAFSALVLADMYQDPFWLERFGERGRRYAAEDSTHHVRYLVQALVAGDTGVLERYARWLRTVLVARGMCSRHLDEHFERLGVVLASALPGAERAVAYLERARAALHSEDGPARELEAAAPALLDAAVDDLLEHEPSGASVWGERGRAARREQLRYRLSYLCDAAAFGRPELFSEYVGFLVAAACRRGRSAAAVHAEINALARAVGRAPELLAETRARAGELLSAALAELEKRAAESALRTAEGATS